MRHCDFSVQVRVQTRGDHLKQVDSFWGSWTFCCPLETCEFELRCACLQTLHLDLLLQLKLIVVFCKITIRSRDLSKSRHCCALQLQFTSSSFQICLRPKLQLLFFSSTCTQSLDNKKTNNIACFQFHKLSFTIIIILH